MAPADLSPADAAWLERAARIAEEGWGRVHPNPMVGCVVVADGERVGEGHHGRYGGPHAEVEALRAAGPRARGATAYVSLEPCNHHGRTPPCTDALLEAGVTRVVFGAAEPGATEGGGGARLREAGVSVVGPAWGPERARAENPLFFRPPGAPRPWLALKLAVSLDGRISAGAGERTAVSGGEARRWVHRLRSGVDAVLVGGRTARVDDPRLTVRDAPAGRRTPRRVVLDPGARLDPGGRLFDDVERAPVEVFVGPDAPEPRRAALAAAGAAVREVAARDGRLDPGGVLEALHADGVESVLCEGGGRLAAALLEADLVDRLHWIVAARTLGPGGVAALPRDVLPEPGRFVPTPRGCRTLGHDVALTFDRERER